jgi:hypothetical protein
MGGRDVEDQVGPRSEVTRLPSGRRILLSRPESNWRQFRNADRRGLVQIPADWLIMFQFDLCQSGANLRESASRCSSHREAGV